MSRSRDAAGGAAGDAAAAAHPWLAVACRGAAVSTRSWRVRGCARRLAPRTVPGPERRVERCSLGETSSGPRVLTVCVTVMTDVSCESLHTLWLCARL